jgi:hypothetical protein
VFKKPKEAGPSTNSKKAAQPTLSFEELLKIAEQKQKETQKKTLQEEFQDDYASRRRAKEEAERRERRLREEYYTERSNKKVSVPKPSVSKPIETPERTKKPLSNGSVHSKSNSDNGRGRPEKSSASIEPSGSVKRKNPVQDSRSSAQQRNVDQLRQQQMASKSKLGHASVKQEAQRSYSNGVSHERSREEMISRTNQQLSLIDLFGESTDPKSLSSKISNLSADQFKQLHQVIAKTFKTQPNHSYQTANSKSKTSTKTPQYVPTKIQKSESEYDPTVLPNSKYTPSSTRHEEYRPTKINGTTIKKEKESSYGASSKKMTPSNKRPAEYDPEQCSLEKKPKKNGRMLIDLDNCDPDELDRIKKEIEQRKKAALEASKPKPTVSSDCKSAKSAVNAASSMAPRNGFKRSPSPTRPPIGRCLPPIGATYRRGNFSSYVPEEDFDEYDDEEDDDDMNSFIDDGEDLEQQRNDVSSYIREIFGYDKRKYLFDNDEDIEESSFAEQMREEARSAKIGLREDLEDIRREEEELKKKKSKKKRRNMIDDSEED